MTIPPLDSEADAMALPQVRAIYEANREGRASLAEGNAAMLSEAMASAGVRFGAYDSRILMWLANWEVHVVAVIAGWIERAHEAGKAGAAREGGTDDPR
jgi:hypothetical protein